MKRTVIFIETREQVAWLAANDKLRSPEFTLVALTPEACYACDKAAHEYKTLEDYTEQILPEGEKKIYYFIVNRLLGALDNHWALNNLLLREINLTPFQNNFIEFYSRFACVLRLFRLFDNFFSGQIDNIEKILFFINPDSAHFAAIRLAADKYGMPAEALTITPETVEPVAPRRKLRDKIKGHVLIRKVYALKQLLCFDLFCLSKRPARILSLHYTYDVKYVLKELLHRDEDIYLWNPPSIKSPFTLRTAWRNFPINEKELAGKTGESKNTWPQVEADESLRADCVYRGVDFFPVFAPILRQYAEKVLPATMHTYFVAEYLIEKLGLKLLFCAGAYSPHEKAIVTAFKSKNLPVIVYQHGSM